MTDDNLNLDKINLKDSLLRYISFWPWYLYLLSLTIFIIGILLLRYSTNMYYSFAKIEIIDKAQDSEMALPTAMTVFNRSMINLENEMGILKSNSLQLQKLLLSPIKFYISMKVKST